LGHFARDPEARAREARARTKEETVHAPLVGRLITALAEVQAFVGGSVGRLRRGIRRLSWSDRQPPEADHDPVLAMLAAAPVDDEPITDDDRRHIEEGRQAYRDGCVVSAEDVKRACLGARADKDPAAAEQPIAV
jgi:hypothetical protein